MDLNETLDSLEILRRIHRQIDALLPSSEKTVSVQESLLDLLDDERFNVNLFLSFTPNPQTSTPAALCQNIVYDLAYQVKELLQMEGKRQKQILYKHIGHAVDD